MPKKAKLISIDVMSPEGPYRCPHCGGDVMLDSTFLEQVTTRVRCPYCERVVHAPDEDEL